MTKKKNDDFNSSKKIVKNKEYNSIKSRTIKSKKNDKLDTTTKIRIDLERLNDLDSLDTSFLEGRIGKKTKNNRKAKEKILTEKRQIIKHLNLLKNIMFILAFICLITVVIVFFINNSSHISKEKQEENNQQEEAKEEKLIDNNYLFVGDFYSNDISYKIFKVPYVKKVDEDYTTKDIVEHLRESIYQYNPSVLILQIGMNDLEKEISINEIIDNIEKIIVGVMENRPLCKIYIESIYPINEEIEKDILKHVTNDNIIKLNRELKELCENEDVFYIDMYNLLSYQDQLRSKYTNDGVHLNSVGYSVVEKKLKEVVDDNEKEKD